ncbi:hypothetical protein E4T42_08941 [Aureobasidium subglaciale]|nr:hypothetical protein E4T42_08941 [Aureobasidium subglaciale]
MYYTAEELTTDPVPVPDSPTWSSEKAYYDERALLLERLAETLHPLTDDTTSNSDDDSISSSVSVSDSDSDSDTLTVIASTCDRTPSRASTFFTSAFASTSFISVLSSSPRTSLTFRSPQTGTFSFQNSPRKTDSVMGSPSRFPSPIKFSSPSIFKRKNKKAKIVEEEEGVKIEEGDIFQYFKTATVDEKECGEKRLSGNSSVGSSNRSSTTSKNSLNSSSTTVDISDTEHSQIVYASNNHPSLPSSMTSPKIKISASALPELATRSNMDLEAKQYVIERLGRSTVGERQSVSHQYNFVMAQLEKTKHLALEAEGSSDDEDEEMVVKSADDLLMKW